jgi:hypothetical protein
LDTLFVLVPIAISLLWGILCLPSRDQLVSFSPTLLGTLFYCCLVGFHHLKSVRKLNNNQANKSISDLPNNKASKSQTTS